MSLEDEYGQLKSKVVERKKVGARMRRLYCLWIQFKDLLNRDFEAFRNLESEG